MQINFCYFIFVFSLIFGCNGPEKRKDIKDASNNGATIQDSLGDFNDFFKKNHDFYDSKHPDTALVVFLFENYQDFDPNEQIVEYQRFDLDKRKYTRLLESLFSGNENLDEILDTLESNRKKVVDFSRKSVLKDFKEFYGISGRDFDFLVRRQDSIAKPLLKSVLKHDSVSKAEKEYARDCLNKLE